MFGEIKYQIKELIKKSNDDLNKYDIEKIYNTLFQEFKERGIIEEYKIPSGTIYPKIIGYNYLNDPEFYFAYKRKEEKNWNGRSPVCDQIQLSVLRHLNNKEEIREKEFLDILLN